MVSLQVLGPLSVTAADGTPLPLSGPRQRRLLAALVLHRGRVVPADALADLVWPDGSAPGAAALQSLLFRLRQRVPDLDVEHRPPGYVLQVPDAAVDAVRFERSVLDAVAHRAQDPAAALGLLDAALATWRGAPYDDLLDTDAGRIEVERLLELHVRAAEERAELLIEGGRAVEALAELESLVLREPLRERPRHALIDAYAATGRRADALRVFDAYRRLLAEELGVDASPELRARHEALLLDEHPPSTAGSADGRPEPTAATAAAPRTTPTAVAARAPLRRPSSSLVGRDELLAEIGRRTGDRRLLTLVGPGGVGKTRLALEAAHRFAAAFADGVVFCDLTAAGSVPVLAVVMGAARVEHREGQDDVDRLSEVLRHDRCLLVFDNCEHVIDEAAALVDTLLTTTEQLVVLATSRERLAVDGEQLLPVPPLQCAAELAPGVDAPATALFLDRARAAAPGFSPDAEDAALVLDLCRRLDGLPLAIELAAARLHALSVREVLDGLDHSLSVLRGGRRTVDRHRSVEAALRWSTDMLADDELHVLQAAAQFSVAFDAADVGAVLGIGAVDALDRLAGLVERSLAHRDGARFFLLDIVRRFAVEQTPPDRLRTLRLRHAARLAAIAEQLGLALRTDPGFATVEEYVRRLPDVRRAVAVAVEAGEPLVAVRAVLALRSLAITAMTPEPMRWGAEAAAAIVAGRVGHGAHVEEGVGLTPVELDAVVDGLALGALGAWNRGDLDEMRRLLARAERVAGRDHAERYELVAAQGVEDLAHGRLDSAIDRMVRALALPDAQADPQVQSETGGTLAICMAYAHHPDAIATADRLVAEIVPRAGAAGAAWCWYAAGECRLDLDPVAARSLLRRAVACARAGGSAFVEGVAGASLASLDVRAGDLTAAVAQYRRILPLWLRAGVRSPFWTAMRSVAELLAAAGEPDAAARLLGAVTAPESGHAIFGDDDERLAALAAGLRRTLGAAAFERATMSGATLDDAAATELATAAFDRFS